MPRMSGLEPAQAGWLTRLLYRLVRSKTGKLTGHARLVEPIKIVAHHPRLLRGLAGMEMGQAAAKSVPDRLKSLASIRVATLIGCPF